MRKNLLTERAKSCIVQGTCMQLSIVSNNHAWEVTMKIEIEGLFFCVNLFNAFFQYLYDQFN